MQHNLLTVELIIHEHIQIVLFFLDIDWHVYAAAFDPDGDWLRVVLVLEEEGEVLVDLGQLEWLEGKLNAGA